MRNVACTGARPLALTNCLNFGSPERPEIMWEFAEATRGLADAARALGTPVVSGNVSFYNETTGRAIYPTPTIAAVGVLDDWQRHAVAHFARPGLAIVLLGESRARARRQRVARAAARARARRAAARSISSTSGASPTCSSRASRRALIATAHDVSDGGLAVALAECCFTGPARVGARVELSDSLRPDALVFGESTGRVIAATADAQELLALAARHGEQGRVACRPA